MGLTCYKSFHILLYLKFKTCNFLHDFDHAQDFTEKIFKSSRKGTKLCELRDIGFWGLEGSILRVSSFDPFIDKTSLQVFANAFLWCENKKSMIKT